MFKMFNRMKAQSTLEYAVLIIIIIGALLTIQVYIKRGVQGRLKSATDDVGDQYSDGNTNITTTVTSNTKTHDTVGIDESGGTTGQGVTKSTIAGLDQSTTNMQSNIVNVQQEYWGK